MLLLVSLTYASLGQKIHHGYATYYGKQAHGKTTASGERINMNEFVAAHRSIPFGTHIKVTNIKNNKSIVVRIIDRCSKRHPFHFLDLSYGAAKHLDFLNKGRTNITMQILDSTLLSDNNRLIDSQKTVTSKWNILDSLELASRSELLTVKDSTKKFAVIVGSYGTKNSAIQKAASFKKTHKKNTTVREINYKKRKFFQVLAIDFQSFDEAEEYRIFIITKIRNAKVTRY